MSYWMWNVSAGRHVVDIQCGASSSPLQETFASGTIVATG